MFISKEQTQEFTIPGGTKGRLYADHPLKQQTLALVEMSGQYPLEGYSMNEYCTETMFIIDGQATVEVDGQNYELKPADVLMILPKQKYKAAGQVKFLDIITPSWAKEQNKIITE